MENGKIRRLPLQAPFKQAATNKTGSHKQHFLTQMHANK